MLQVGIKHTSTSNSFTMCLHLSNSDREYSEFKHVQTSSWNMGVIGKQNMQAVTKLDSEIIFT